MRVNFNSLLGASVLKTSYGATGLLCNPAANCALKNFYLFASVLVVHNIVGRSTYCHNILESVSI